MPRRDGRDVARLWRAPPASFPTLHSRGSDPSSARSDNRNSGKGNGSGPWPLVLSTCGRHAENRSTCKVQRSTLNCGPSHLLCFIRLLMDEVKGTKLDVLPEEGHLYSPGRAVPLFGDYDLGLGVPLRILSPGLSDLIVAGPVQKDHDIRVLLNGPGFPEVRELRALSLLGSPRELRQRHYRDLQLLGHRLQAPADL